MPEQDSDPYRTIESAPPDEYLQTVTEQTREALEPEPGHEPSQSMLEFLEFLPKMYSYGESLRQKDPEGMVQFFLEQFNAAHAHVAPFDSLTKAFSRFPLTTGRLHRMQLSPYEESVLLKATAYAGSSRGTESGLKLARRSMSIMRHEISNSPGKPKQGGGSESLALWYERSLDKMCRTFFVGAAYHELTERLGSEPIVSIDDVIRRWSDIAASPGTPEKTQLLERLSEPAPAPEKRVATAENEPHAFVPIAENELRDRLSGLAYLGSQLKERFGDDVRINYYNPTLFTTLADTTELRPERTKTRKSREKTGASPVFSSDYVISEIIVHHPDGTEATHAVAESPVYGNATYVLRSDVVEAMAQLTGLPLTWQDVLMYPKVTARQLGARDFRHTKESDTASRINQYLGRPIGPELASISHAWLHAAKPLFTEGFVPTDKNRLPGFVRDTLSAHAAEALATLASWEEGARPLRRRVGRTATTGAAIETDPSNLIAKVLDENRELRLANKALSQRVVELQQRLRTVRQLAADDE